MNNHLSRVFLIIFMCLISFVAFTQEATVYMQNGKELPPGKVLLIDNGVLVYKSEYGDLSVPIDQVDQIVFTSGTKDREGIVLSTGDWMGGIVTSYRDGVWQIKTEFGQAVVTKPNTVTSVNFSKPKVLALKGLAMKGVTYRYVVDWLYSTEIVLGQDQNAWSIKVDRITFVNNQIIMNCSIKCASRILVLNPTFRIDDEFGNQYNPIKTTFPNGEYSFVTWKSGQVAFPNLKEGSKVIVFWVYSSGPYNWSSSPKIEIADIMSY